MAIAEVEICVVIVSVNKKSAIAIAANTRYFFGLIGLDLINPDKKINPPALLIRVIQIALASTVFTINPDKLQRTTAIKIEI